MAVPSRHEAIQFKVEERLHAIYQSFAGQTRVSYRYAGGELSYAQLYSRAAILRHELANGPLAGAARPPVLIWGHKDPRYLIAYWACLTGGWALVPVEPETPVERVRQIASACGAGALLIADPDTRIEAQLADLVPIVRIDRDGDGAARAANDETGPLPSAGINPHDVAYIMFSSGTLGHPKGIQVSYANLIDFIDWLALLLPEAATWQSVSGNIRYCFDVSLFEIWTAWLHLLPVTALDHTDLANSNGLIQRLAADRVSLWVSTPSIIRLYLKNPRFTAETLPECRTFLFCGEPLTKILVRKLFERFPGCRVINTYGPTECTVAVTAVDITEAHLAAPQELPIGYARPGTTLEHLSQSEPMAGDGGEPLAGEICIRGLSVGNGYINLPEKQAAAFPEPELYRTGDWGYRANDGLWYFKGRVDRETKIQGVRVDLDDVEMHVRSLPGVDDAVVSVYSLDGQPRALNAFVLGPHNQADLRTLAELLAAELPPYLVPRFWYADFDVKLNNNSKLDRKEIITTVGKARSRYVHCVLAAGVRREL
ncbi:D-alanine--poly(phosphoribitol) ligase [Mesorhizobium loti]|nr:AMP-binding protein [Mesorhizobium loti]PLP59148.1 D-alanine--poly(phosphoribitol) ligase [Mesorhizobium loti]